MDFLSGHDLTIKVMFLAFGKPVVPDTGSVTYTFYDDEGEVIDADVTLTPASGAITTTIPLEAVDNEIDETKRFERRTVIVNFEKGDQSYSVRQSYRLIPFLNYDLDSSQVRSALGVSPKELADGEIDIVGAYFGVEAIEGMSATILSDALKSTDISIRKAANDAILYTAVLGQVGSLQLRLSQSETNGPIGFKRFASTPDFALIGRTALARLSSAISKLTGSTAVVVPILSFTDSIDTTIFPDQPIVVT